MTNQTPFAGVREALGDGPGPARRQMQRSRLLQAPAGPGTGAAKARWAFWAAAAAGFAAVVVLHPTPPRLPGEPIAVGTALRAPAASPMQLTFGEASQVVLAAGGEATLEAVDAAHVDVRLTRGHLDAKVTKHTGRVWRYLAGPYEVRVVGTELSVAWQPETKELEVRVREGAVEVRGPELDAPALVRGGERWFRPGVELTRAAPPASTPALPPEVHPAEPPAAPEAHVRTRPALTAPAGDGGNAQPSQPDEAPAPDWHALLKSGARRQALEAAERAGVLTRPELLNASELLRLADAARIERHPTAENLLSRCVARGGEEGAEAAFQLGKLQQDRGELAAAVGSFRDAQRLDPDDFDDLASGRLLELLTQLKDPSARSLAQDYLRKHPGGPWAPAAKKVLESAP